jgi:uncharacterized protein
MELLHKAIDFQVRAVGDPADRILEFVGSTADVDRYGDIIEVEGWDTKNYLKTGAPFLWAHMGSMPPLGNALKVSKSPEGLKFQIKFATPETYGDGWPSTIPTPDTVYRLYRNGVMGATSVGFNGLEREPILGPADDQGYRPQTGWRFKKQELYELSAVPVPANPNALMIAVQKGIITEKEAEPFLAAATPEPEGEGDNGNLFAELGAKVRSLQGELEQAKEELAQVKAQAAAPLKFDLVLSEEQLEKIKAELEPKTGVIPETKTGAVLNAKNKAALQQAVALIQQVLTAADPASDEGKSVTPTQSIYSLALNPGDEPQGERPAGELSVDMAEILNLTKNFYQTVCPGK